MPAIVFSAALLPLGVTTEQAEKLFVAALKRDKLREQAADAEAEYRSNLPFATDAQMDVVCRHAADETDLPEGCKANVDFVLSDAQQARLELVRADRRKWCADHKDEIVASLASNTSEKLVSFKVRAGAKKTTTTLRFERSHGQPAKGLIAALQRAASIQSEPQS